MPKFSVIITTHSRPLLLARAVDSVLGQTHDDCEIILISDERSYGTYDVASRLLRSRDTFVQRSGAAGPSISRNAGLNLSKGDFVLFLDDDDSYLPNLLEELSARLGRLEGDVFYFDYDILTEVRSDRGVEIVERSSNHTNAENIDNLMVYNFIPNNAVCITASTAKSFRFDETLRSHEDWDFLVAMMRGGCRFTHVPILGACVHRDPDSSQRNRQAAIAGHRGLDFLHIYRRWPALTALQREGRRDMLKSLGHDVDAEHL